MNKIIVITGMSGAGKTFLISKALQIINDLQVVTAITTRPIRENETNLITSKQHVSKDIFMQLYAEGRLCLVNNIYGYLYGFEKDEIEKKLKNTSIILEYKASKISDIKKMYKNSYAIYIYGNYGIAHLNNRNNLKVRYAQDMEEKNYILNNLSRNNMIDEIFYNKFDEESIHRFLKCIFKLLGKG